MKIVSDLRAQTMPSQYDSPERVVGIVGPESNLSEDLVGEGARHDKRRVTVSASQVDETTISKEDDVSSAGHGISVNLRLDVDVLLCVGLEPGDVDFDIEVSNVADNGVLLHLLKVLGSDNITAAGGRDKDLTLWSGLVHGCDLVSSHSSLQRIDRVNLSDDDTGTVGSERLGALYSHNRSRQNQIATLTCHGNVDLHLFRRHRIPQRQRPFQPT